MKRVWKLHCYDFKLHTASNLSKTAFRGTPFNCVDSFTDTLHMCNLLYVNYISVSFFFFNYHLNFRIASKKDIYNYVKSLLKYSAFFQLHTCTRPDFLHMFQVKEPITAEGIQLTDNKNTAVFH